jgi:DNA-binding response OmpR family regulator
LYKRVSRERTFVPLVSDALVRVILYNQPENLSFVPTLLIIEDQRIILDAIRHVFAAQGFDVLTAERGAAGMELFDTRVVDGVLADIHMPGLNGIDVCRELRTRASQAGRELPVWLMTGACTVSLRKLAVAAGAIKVFEKPFDLVELGRELLSYFDAAAGSPRVDGI